MLCPIIVLSAYSIELSEQRLTARLAPLKENGMDKMLAAQQEITDPYHHLMFVELMACIYHLGIAGLITVAILRLPKSN